MLICTPKSLRIFYFSLETEQGTRQRAAQLRIIQELLFCGETIWKIGQIQSDGGVTITTVPTLLVVNDKLQLMLPSDLGC